MPQRAKSHDTDKLNTAGRKANAAQPLGDRKGLVAPEETKKTAKAERRSAGPDGPRADAVGKTFKH